MRFTFTLLLCIWGVVGLQTQTLLQYAVDFTATDTKNGTHTLFDYLDDDKHVILCFLYSTCSPCTTAVEPLVQIYHDMGCNMGDLIVLAVNYNETDETVITYQQNNYFPIPYISGQDGGGNAVFFSYQIQTFPTVILIQPDRFILNQDIYPVTLELLEYALFEQAGLSPKYDICPLPVVSTQDVSEPDIVWQIFPNPASNQARLRTLHEREGVISLQLRLYTVQGNIVQYWAKESLKAEEEISLPLDGIPSGTYILSIQQTGRRTVGLPLQIIR
jgi:peroxiredoxin